MTTVRDGGLYDVLLPEFEARSGYRVALAVAEDVYGPARAGRADIVFSHFGHPDVDTFVQAGLGQWPRPVLFNQVCVIGPTTDPAQVANVADLVAVFQRIARSGAPFVVNDIEGLRYSTTTARSPPAPSAPDSPKPPREPTPTASPANSPTPHPRRPTGRRCSQPPVPRGPLPRWMRC